MNYEEILDYANRQEEKYEELETPHKKTELQIEAREKRILKLKEKKEKQLKTFYKKADKLDHNWKDTILKPIAEEVCKKFDDLNSYEIVGCFGLNCECSIWFFNNEEDMKKSDLDKLKASLHFMPIFGKTGVLIWTGKLDDSYEKGSLGDLNGDNKIMEEVTSLEQVFNYVEKSLQSKKECVVK